MRCREGGKVRRIVGVGCDGQDVEPNCSLSHGPAPELGWKLSAGKERLCHASNELPALFNLSVLRLSSRRSRRDGASMGLQQSLGLPANESRVKITLDLARKASGLDEELPKSFLNIRSGGTFHAKDPGVSGATIH